MFCIYLDLIYEHIYVARFQNEIKFIFDKKKLEKNIRKDRFYLILNETNSKNPFLLP